ncbi:MAG: hypothetical protein M1813_008455 [Trichoglossum hirsutum]|nr:MAG: hypothetical protein M1813_008455 [Trichoglossum hirsutum]
MKGFSLLHAGACLSLVASTVIGAAVTPRSEITRRQDGPNSTNFTPTIGVPGGEVLQRLPIKRLRHEQPDVFNMFILALDSFKKKDPSDFMSWFRISGIHGYPYEPFQYPQSSVVNPGYGYCTHHSVIFLPWHRPYLALMEQALSAEACNVANKFTDSDKWHAAAKKIRLPYWDWSDEGQKRIPELAQKKTISVTQPGPDGAPVTADIPNPLLQYTPPGQYVADIGSETTRDPAASANMASTFAARKQQTVDLFAITDFNRFQKQLESIHDSVHVIVGGSMAVVNYAAFDPIFWMHHCNVDRLMAMYQNIMRNATMTPGLRSPTLALGGDVNDTITTPMYPFRHPDGDEWTPDELKSYTSIFELGYSYPEVLPKQVAKRADDRGHGNHRNTTTKTASSNHTVVQLNSLYAPDNATMQTRIEWSTVVLVDTADFNESCRIMIFISASNNATSGPVGVAPIFIGQMESKGIDTHVNATIPLTEALKSRGHGSLEPEDVVPTLKAELFWTIEKVGNTGNIPPESIPSLRVAVFSREASYATNKIPTKGDSTPYYDATTGKPGGLKEGDPPILKVATVTNLSDS